MSFEIDETSFHCVTITSKKNGNGYYSYLKMKISFSKFGDVFTKFLVICDDVDTKPFNDLVEAIEKFNSIR